MVAQCIVLSSTHKSIDISYELDVCTVQRSRNIKRKSKLNCISCC